MLGILCCLSRDKSLPFLLSIFREFLDGSKAGQFMGSLTDRQDWERLRQLLGLPESSNCQLLASCGDRDNPGFLVSVTKSQFVNLLSQQLWSQLHLFCFRGYPADPLPWDRSQEWITCHIEKDFCWFCSPPSKAVHLVSVSCAWLVIHPVTCPSWAAAKHHIHLLHNCISTFSLPRTHCWNQKISLWRQCLTLTVCKPAVTTWGGWP